MKLKEIMNKPVFVEEDISLSEAAGILSSKKISCLLFVKNSKILGIVTESDLVKNFGKKDVISDIMTKKVITIPSDATLDAALDAMNANKIKKLPVLEKEKLVGIITITEIMANTDKLEEDFFFG